MNLILKILKKCWKIIAGVAVVLLSIFAISSIRKRKTIEKFNKQIDDNEKATEKLQGKIEQVEEQKIEVKTKIVAKKKQIKKTEQLKTKKPAPKKKSITSAKKNIISKTKKK